MKNKKIILLSLSSFLFGAAFLFFVLRSQPEIAATVLGLAPKTSRVSDPLSAFRSQALGQDPFEAMERMHEDLAGFPSLMAMGGEGEHEIVEREDDHSFYYEISGIDQTKLSAKVDNGALTIKGETKKESGKESGFSATMQSTFQRTFSLPPNVDESKMEMSSEKDKVILRFPKRS